MMSSEKECFICLGTEALVDIEVCCGTLSVHDKCFNEYYNKCKIECPVCKKDISDKLYIKKKLLFRWNTLIKTLPELPITLKKLDCSACCQLKTIPKLPITLKKLDCSKCYQLKTIQNLPKTLNCEFCKELEDSSYLPVNKVPKISELDSIDDIINRIAKL